MFTPGKLYEAQYQDFKTLKFTTVAPVLCKSVDEETGYVTFASHFTAFEGGIGFMDDPVYEFGGVPSEPDMGAVLVAGCMLWISPEPLDTYPVVIHDPEEEVTYAYTPEEAVDLMFDSVEVD